MRLIHFPLKQRPASRNSSVADYVSVVAESASADGEDVEAESAGNSVEVDVGESERKSEGPITTGGNETVDLDVGSNQSVGGGIVGAGVNGDAQSMLDGEDEKREEEKRSGSEPPLAGRKPSSTKQPRGRYDWTSFVHLQVTTRDFFIQFPEMHTRIALQTLAWASSLFIWSFFIVRHRVLRSYSTLLYTLFACRRKTQGDEEAEPQAVSSVAKSAKRRWSSIPGLSCVPGRSLSGRRVSEGRFSLVVTNGGC